MRGGAKTTYILMERGVEDMQLLAELHKMTSATGIKGSKEFIKTYPLIHELKCALQDEKEEIA